MIVDCAGNYAYSYNICGIGMCLSGVILLTILIHKQCDKRPGDTQCDTDKQPPKADSKLEPITNARKEIEIC